MALGIYREIASGTFVTYGDYDAVGNAFPISSTHDGTLGEAVITQLFVHNDDPARYYTDVSLVAECLTTPDDTLGRKTGWGIKLIRAVPPPTEAEWASTDYGTTITFPDFGASGSPDITTYLPFWVRVECPAGQKSAVRENILLSIYFEFGAA